MTGATVTDAGPPEAEATDAVLPRAPEGSGMARASLINLVGSLVYGVTGFLLIVVITRRLGTRGAGALLEAIAVFSIVSRSTMAGTDVGLVRFTSRFLTRDRAAEVRRLYAVALVPVLVLSSLAGMALFVGADPLGRLLTSGHSSDTLSTYLRVLAPFLPVAAVYQAVDGATRGFGSMLPSVVVERIGRSAALPPLVLLAISAGGGAALIGAAWAAPFAVALVPMALWTARLLRRAEQSLRDRVARAPADAAVAPPEPLAPPELARRFWSFALPRSFAGVFALTITWVDSLLLGAMEGTGAVGVYSSAIRWLIVGNVAGNAVTMAFAPQIARVMAADPDDAKPLFQEASALLVLLAWPAYAVAMVFAPILLTTFGDGFSGGAAVIAITGVGFLLASAAGPIDMLLLMAGRSRLSLINTGVALVVNIGANLLLIPPYGIKGAALAWTISLMVANGLPLAQMWKMLGVHPFGARTVRTMALAAGVAAALVAARALLGPTIGGLALGLALGGAVLLAGIWSSPDHLGVDQVLRRPAR
ncbi:oligosaccharide flippase family protein [Iamia sp. SCSIO 61187]|uniref:oligosaccharide flippase family protein n=1 Tax=Iamia sp. SCSIO 61187 TaxID=2722752 RepID=UPI001C62BED8|nr:polysaccharide biosynthesis C-terminal domain-containing protein [Iamia sp. SCSIO 61187]QYG92367.1 oligosaccharide flippase family protein [Iamia sp. SCSIO 61187]